MGSAPGLGGVRHRLGAGVAECEGLLLAPGVGVDVDAVAVLREAVDERETQAAPGRRVPHCLNARLVLMTSRPVFVPAADDVVEEVRGAAARQVADLVEDQKRRAGVFAQPPRSEGGQRLLLQEVRERGGERREPYGEALLEREHAEIERDHRLADAAGASKQDVVPLGDEAEGADVIDDLARMARGWFQSKPSRV